jgi:hypothetical protein
VGQPGLDVGIIHMQVAVGLEKVLEGVVIRIGESGLLNGAVAVLRSGLQLEDAPGLAFLEKDSIDVADQPHFGFETRNGELGGQFLFLSD